MVLFNWQVTLAASHLHQWTLVAFRENACRTENHCVLYGYCLSVAANSLTTDPPCSLLLTHIGGFPLVRNPEALLMAHSPA